MLEISDEPINLDWVRKISLRSLMALPSEQLERIQLQADKEIIRAELNKERIKTAIQLRFSETEEEADG